MTVFQPLQRGKYPHHPYTQTVLEQLSNNVSRLTSILSYSICSQHQCALSCNIHDSVHKILCFKLTACQLLLIQLEKQVIGQRPASENLYYYADVFVCKCVWVRITGKRKIFGTYFVVWILTLLLVPIND